MENREDKMIENRKMKENGKKIEKEERVISTTINIKPLSPESTPKENQTPSLSENLVFFFFFFERIRMAGCPNIANEAMPDHPSDERAIAEFQRELNSSGNHQLLQQIRAANPSEQNTSANQGAGDILGTPSGKAKQKKRKFYGATKKRTKKRREDDDSWMPEGWVKVVRRRPLTGKFPGYEDKFYYAPGVAKPFRSKVASLRYIEKLKNATAGGQIHN
ncbi:hypothetical protein BUALT_Bualt07G0072500 [Buddleja alternifolia]|uniref:MBD domain-containing protein n=1 Tax=Buddleja alternifolia TaxID=168488 RepID=A0AAV6XA88_9LAMI|nr:hypothetical protein BUALT_Bualt07G0072500 [Buddleja alternifolia]